VAEQTGFEVSKIIPDGDANQIWAREAIISDIASTKAKDGLSKNELSQYNKKANNLTGSEKGFRHASMLPRKHKITSSI